MVENEETYFLCFRLVIVHILLVATKGYWKIGE